MTLRLPPVQPRSRKALEAAEVAREQGLFDRMHSALFKTFFEHGLDIGEIDVREDGVLGRCGTWSCRRWSSCSGWPHWCPDLGCI